MAMRSKNNNRLPAEEARHVASFFGAERIAALGLVERQLNALHMRAQVVIGFAAVAVTTTGFSGRLIAGTNAFAQVCIIAGLAIIVASCMFLFLRVLAIEWVVTRFLGEDFLSSLERMIAYRDAKTRAYRLGCVAVFLGFAIYAIALAIMLLNPEPLTVPVR